MSSKTVTNVYWDACAWFGYLKGEPDKIDACKQVIDAAKQGQYLIWGSAVSLVEVLHLGQLNHKHVPPEHIQIIRRAFREPYVKLVAADFKVCQNAQELYWQYPNLKWKDSVHLATAVLHEVPTIHSYDPDFLDLNGKLGNPPVQITKPGVSQQSLPL